MLIIWILTDKYCFDDISAIENSIAASLRNTTLYSIYVWRLHQFHSSVLTSVWNENQFFLYQIAETLKYFVLFSLFFRWDCVPVVTIWVLLFKFIVPFKDSSVGFITLYDIISSTWFWFSDVSREFKCSWLSILTFFEWYLINFRQNTSTFRLD